MHIRSSSSTVASRRRLIRAHNADANWKLTFNFGICRALIARTVADDPETFTEALLERPNDEYCAWILDESNWGGYIELFILSKCAALRLLALLQMRRMSS